MHNAQNNSASPDADGMAALMRRIGAQARAAARIVATAGTAAKNHALQAMADLLQTRAQELRQANRRDLDAGKANGLDAALMDRLALTPARIAAMAEGLRQVAALPDPVGQLTDVNPRPSGIRVGKLRVPLGVIGIIYESRPNVTADAAALCLKSGNAVVLRGGSEALHSNRAIAACLAEGLVDAGLPAHAVQVIDTTDRAAVGHLITLPEYIDVIVPRGGKGLIERISREARVPVIKHLDGICHVYLDAAADRDKALAIAINAKTHRYGVCNAMETLLVHADVAAAWLPLLAERYAQAGVALCGCDRTCALVKTATAATDADWRTEYLAPRLSIRVVETMQQAIDHIETYGSHHTDAIVTEDYSRAMRFLQAVDSASVMVNASTRFADGAEFGLGAEIGISTDKLHARGPVGLEGLTTQKFVVFGDGEIRQ